MLASISRSLRSVARYLQVPDLYICAAGLVSYALGLVTLALSSTAPVIFLSGLLGMGSRLADSILRSLVSQVPMLRCNTLSSVSHLLHFRVWTRTRLGKYSDLSR